MGFPALERVDRQAEASELFPTDTEISCISPIFLFPRLELDHPIFADKILESIGKSTWFDIDHGRFLLEIRNPNYRARLQGSAADVLDYDDTLFAATEYHSREFEGLAGSTNLQRRGIHMSVAEAREIYQLSKILIQGIVDTEPRYTPLLNILLLTRYVSFLEVGTEKDKAMQQLRDERETAVQLLTAMGEGYLRTVKFDKDINDIFALNDPASCIYTKFLPLIFNNPVNAGDLKIIATRGKIEGPWGQVYKLHASGIMNQPVDLVLYSNDLKAEGILLLSKLFPQLHQMCIRVFDDNEQEILPYWETAIAQGLTNLKLIHVRHPGAKRRNIDVDPKIKPHFSFTDPSSGIIFDHFLPIPGYYFVF